MDNQRGVQFSVLSQHSLIKTQEDSASNFGDPSISYQESGQSEQPIREKIQMKNSYWKIPVEKVQMKKSKWKSSKEKVPMKRGRSSWVV